MVNALIHVPLEQFSLMIHVKNVTHLQVVYNAVNMIQFYVNNVVMDIVLLMDFVNGLLTLWMIHKLIKHYQIILIIKITQTHMNNRKMRNN